jgi:nucleoside-diphosphate-sugar epimerase
MTESRVLVTGASGFIGGRLVEKIVSRGGGPVRALVRSWGRAVRLARFDIELMRGDIGSAEDLDRAVAGCGVVFHCAHDFKDPRRNVSAVTALADSCLRHDVRRLVVLSSMSVYEPLPDGLLDESSPRRVSGREYSDTKIELEFELERIRAQTGLPVVILEPTVVYGPYSSWTARPIRRLRQSRLVLPDDGNGLAHVVYVDDVVESLLLAAESESAVGERILVSGPEPVTWRRYYGAYERMIGVDSVVLVPTHEIVRAQTGGELGRAAALVRRDSAAIARKTAGAVRRLAGPRLMDAVVRGVGTTLPRPLLWPDEQALALYRSKADLRLDHARLKLDYEPRVNFERGIELTRQFVTWSRL